MTPTAFAALATFLTALLATPLVKRVAIAAGAVAVPKADRWHRGVVPLMGGVSLFVAVLVGFVLLRVTDLRAWALLGGASALFAVGLVDDIRPLKPQSKLLAQIVVATALFGLGLQLNVTGVVVLDLLITILWVVGITNAFNLLDNMDGLAAGIAAISVGFHLLFFLIEGEAGGAVVSAIVVGALLGFLVFNFNPASIFMGDAGSLFVGMWVSGLPLIATTPNSQGAVTALLFPVLIVLVPIFDTTLVAIARTIAGRRISVGGRDHTSHRLVALGLSERAAVLMLYGVSAASGGVAILSQVYGLSVGVVFIVLLAIGLGLLGVYLGKLRVYPERDVPAVETPRFFSLVADFSYKRQLATIVVDTVLIVLAYHAAYLLRFEEAFALERSIFVASLPVVVACQLSAFAVFRVYQGIWRYTSFSDLLRLAQAATVGSVLAVLVILGLYRFEGYSRAVFVLNWLLLLAFVAACRLAYRALGELLRPGVAEGTRRVLVYGAGDGGLMVLRELANNRTLGKVVVAFLDDDRGKARTTLAGIPVVGGIERLEQALDQFGIDEVIVSTDKIRAGRLHVLEEELSNRDIPVMKASLKLE